MTKLAPEWVRTSDPVIRSPARYCWTTAPAVDEGKEVRVVFLDISRAFDGVWHVGLLHKLRKAGITGSLLDWLGNYLKDRKQRVCLNGE